MTATRRFVTLPTLLLAALAGGASAQPTMTREQALATAGGICSLVDRLYSPEAKARAEAACEIGRRGATAAAAIPVLLSMLSDDVTVSALECEMSPWLRRTLQASPDAVKWSETSPAKEAAEALGDIGNASVPGLLQALSHSDWKTRKFAAVGLGEIDHIAQLPTVLAALAGRLTDAHVEVRDQSAWALGEIEDATAVEPLSECLARPRSPSSRARRVGLGRDRRSVGGEGPRGGAQ